jgi:hypothetical protein
MIWAKGIIDLAYEISLSYFAEFFKFHKILRHGVNCFISPPKCLMRIFIDLKSPSPSAGFEPANLGSSGKHAKYYATEATKW